MRNPRGFRASILGYRSSILLGLFCCIFSIKNGLPNEIDNPETGVNVPKRSKVCVEISIFQDGLEKFLESIQEEHRNGSLLSTGSLMVDSYSKSIQPSRFTNWFWDLLTGEDRHNVSAYSAFITSVSDYRNVLLDHATDWSAFSAQYQKLFPVGFLAKKTRIFLDQILQTQRRREYIVTRDLGRETQVALLAILKLENIFHSYNAIVKELSPPEFDAFIVLQKRASQSKSAAPISLSKSLRVIQVGAGKSESLLESYDAISRQHDAINLQWNTNKALFLEEHFDPQFDSAEALARFETLSYELLKEVSLESFSADLSYKESFLRNWTSALRETRKTQSANFLDWQTQMTMSAIFAKYEVFGDDVGIWVDRLRKLKSDLVKVNRNFTLEHALSLVAHGFRNAEYFARVGNRRAEYADADRWLIIQKAVDRTIWFQKMITLDQGSEKLGMRNAVLLAQAEDSLAPKTMQDFEAEHIFKFYSILKRHLGPAASGVLTQVYFRSRAVQSTNMKPEAIALELVEKFKLFQGAFKYSLLDFEHLSGRSAFSIPTTYNKNELNDGTIREFEQALAFAAVYPQVANRTLDALPETNLFPLTLWNQIFQYTWDVRPILD